MTWLQWNTNLLYTKKNPLNIFTKHFWVWKIWLGFSLQQPFLISPGRGLLLRCPGVLKLGLCYLRGCLEIGRSHEASDLSNTKANLKSLLVSIHNFQSQAVSLTLSLIRHSGNIRAEITRCVRVAFSSRCRRCLAARLPPALTFLLCALTFPAGVQQLTRGSRVEQRKS